MNRHVRAFAKWQSIQPGFGDEDFRARKPIAFDSYINDNDTMVFKASSYGTLGALNNKNERLPFILQTDGTLDFGSSCESRLFTTNLKDKQIRVGDLFTIWDEHRNECIYRIDRVERLA